MIPISLSITSSSTKSISLLRQEVEVHLWGPDKRKKHFFARLWGVKRSHRDEVVTLFDWRWKRCEVFWAGKNIYTNYIDSDIDTTSSEKLLARKVDNHKNVVRLPSRKLTYPTFGKGNSSFLGGDMLVSSRLNASPDLHWGFLIHLKWFLEDFFHRALKVGKQMMCSKWFGLYSRESVTLRA